jgi:hypothetical protein
MKHPMILRAALTMLALAVSVPALADRGSRSGRHAGPSHGGSHYSGGHHRHHGGHRHHGARIGAYIGLPLLASAYYYSAPRYYAPAYVAPSPAYFCPEYGDYYPRVPACPGPWQLVY